MRDQDGEVAPPTLDNSEEGDLEDEEAEREAFERAEWHKRWKLEGQPWRTEPEITAERQTYLATLRARSPDIERGLYPFKDMDSKLTRADVEWLLATHASENQIGPVEVDDAGPVYPYLENENLNIRVGLDLRGADLSGVNLSRLPLARLIGGLEYNIYPDATSEQRKRAAIHLEGADLWHTQLQEAELIAASLKGAFMPGANLEGAYLGEANLDEAYLSGANIESADFFKASLRQTKLERVKATLAQFIEANLDGAILEHATLHRASFQRAHAEQARFEQAELMRADLSEADLALAWFKNARLMGANLSSAYLAGAFLHEAFFDETTRLNFVTLASNMHGTAILSDIHWGDVNLAVVRWAEVPANVGRPVIGTWKRLSTHVKQHLALPDQHSIELTLWETALRTNRQLSVVLRNQGLNEDADRFAYEALRCRRTVLWKRGNRGAAAWAGFLDILAGYGYKPLRSFAAYLMIVLTFAVLYYVFGPASRVPLTPLGALVFSMTSFHGRGFFPGGIPLDDALTVLAAGEAFVGLIIEVSFIATFTQRFFGK